MQTVQAVQHCTKWIFTCATFQLTGVMAWLVISFDLTFVLVTLYMQTKLVFKIRQNNTRLSYYNVKTRLIDLV